MIRILTGQQCSVLYNKYCITYTKNTNLHKKIHKFLLLFKINLYLCIVIIKHI